MSRMAEGKGGQEKERKKRERNCLWARGARRGCRIRRGALPVRTWRPCVCGVAPARLPSAASPFIGPRVALSYTCGAQRGSPERAAVGDRPAGQDTLPPFLQWSHLFILFSPPFLDKKTMTLGCY